MFALRALLSLMATLMLLSLPAAAADPQDSDAGAAQALLPDIARTLGGKPQDFEARLLPGGHVVEVYWKENNRIVYLDRSLNFLMVGSLFDTASKENLTQSRGHALNRIPIDSLPLDKVIKVVKGKGTTRFAVFEDPDCPFCRAMEARLDELPDYTAYILLFPITELHPGAERAAKAIWCAPDPSAAWLAYMHTRALPEARECETPIAELRALAQRHHIEGTPTLLMPDGEIVEGMPELSVLQAKVAAATAR